MKSYILIFALSFCLTSHFTHAQSGRVFLEGKIKNRNGDTLQLMSETSIIRSIVLDKQGNFRDSVNLSSGIYILYDNVEFTHVFLRKGYRLKLTADAKLFDETIHYEGSGAKENNFLAKQMLMGENYEKQYELATNESELDKLIEGRRQDINNKMDSLKLDPDFIAAEKESLEQELQIDKSRASKRFALAKLLNTTSPSFAYENVKGEIINLSDLKGKYVFIDIWATWCKPCLAEIPHLKNLEVKYDGKNIAFVSISIDFQKDRNKWENFVVNKSLTGIQLITDKDWKSDFIKHYGVTSIPRFILVDPKGTIVDADAERPSSPKLMEQLDKLLL